jgi:hypothetical protein
MALIQMRMFNEKMKFLIGASICGMVPDDLTDAFLIYVSVNIVTICVRNRIVFYYTFSSYM